MAANAHLAAAYAALIQRGEKPSVRALQTEAKVRTAEAAAWLKENVTAVSKEAPEMPNLGEGLDQLAAVLWSKAWMSASEVAAEASQASLHDAIDAQRASEERATEADEARRSAEGERERASANQERAERERDAAREALARTEADLERMRKELEDARREARDARDAQVAAEASAALLRELLTEARAEGTTKK